MPPPDPWLISDELREHLDGTGLRELSDLAGNQQPTEFDSKVVDALLIYSKCSIARELSEKLIFVLVALECLLLKDQSEPIQVSIGERMAFMLGTSPKERKEVVGLVKKVYAQRSKFIHHGQPTADIESLRSFFRDAWAVLLSAVKLTKRLTKKEELLDYLEERKFS